MTRNSLPTRTLPARPDLDQLKRQAKELLEAFRSGAAEAVAEVNTHYHDAKAATFELHDAQLVLARAHGFESWPKLKAYVDGATSRRLSEAVRAGDLAQVRAILKVRPELAGAALLDAVLDRTPAMVRVLMEHGAHAGSGVYPHRDATSPLTIAIERGYDDIVAIINTEEQRRREAQSGVEGVPPPDALFRAIASGHGVHAIGMLEGNPALIHTGQPLLGLTPLHMAAKVLDKRIVTWLLDHGADVAALAGHPHPIAPRHTALDLAAHWSTEATAERFAAVAAALLRHGAQMTPRAAVALREADWLRARHAEGVLFNPIEDSGGLLRIAVSHNRPDMLAMLLDFGFDPDERTRFFAVGVDDVAFTWGMPLWHCAGSGKYMMAEMLLERGADPKAQVYASGSPVSEAYGRRDWKMITLLERYGGVAEPWVAALYRQTDLAKKLLAESPDKRTTAAQLLGSAACGGDPEIVRLALEHVDWPRDDPRWFGVLEQPLRIWNHGSGHWAKPDWDRITYRTCFRMILERCDPNILGRLNEHGFGLTILHSVAGSREHVTADERVAFATMLLDAGARLDVRDHLLKSTPLGWACRWGRVELVKLLLERGADPAETDAEPWATPLAWARKKGHAEIEVDLRQAGAR